MYQPYEDITSRLGKPLWWDENGVPRYEPFEPSLCADIYAKHAALLLIACQSCGEKFPVASTWSVTDGVRDGKVVGPTMPTIGDSGSFSFGDAPWHGEQQCSGTTMMTVNQRVLEFWTRENFEWVRQPQYELDVEEKDEILRR